MQTLPPTAQASEHYLFNSYLRSLYLRKRLFFFKN